MKDWVGATLLKRMGIRMSDYITEMDEQHEMEAREEEEEEEKERTEAEEGEEGEGQERERVEKRVPMDRMAPMDAGGSVERASSPPRVAQAMAVAHRSLAYTMLADEMRMLKAEMKELRAAVSEQHSDMSTIERKVDLLLMHFGIIALAPEAPPPTVYPSQDPNPTITMDELTAEQTPTDAKPLQPLSPRDPHTSS